MFGNLPSDPSSLTTDQRVALADMLIERNRYLEKQIEHSKLRIEALINPSPAADEAVSDFGSTVIAPLRDGFMQKVLPLLGEAVDVEGLKQMLPMMGFALLQSINLPLLMTTLNLDPDEIDMLIGKITEFVKSDLG